VGEPLQQTWLAAQLVALLHSMDVLPALQLPAGTHDPIPKFPRAPAKPPPAPPAPPNNPPIPPPPPPNSIPQHAFPMPQELPPPMRLHEFVEPPLSDETLESFEFPASFAGPFEFDEDWPQATASPMHNEAPNQILM
jgi:hypothetical protein